MTTRHPSPRPARMGSRLLAFRDRNGWDTAGLAAFLRCDAQGLTRLVFRPLPDSGDIAAIERAAALAACDPDRLARALNAEIDARC